MSTIYLILGIVGWSAAAIVLPLYFWRGTTPTAPRSDPSTTIRASISDRTTVGVFQD